MILRSHAAIFWRQLSLLAGLLIITVLLDKFLDFRSGYLLYSELAVKTALVALIAKIAYTLLAYIMTAHYKQAYNKDPSHFMIQILQCIVFFFAVLTIIVFVLNKSIFSIMALGGIVSAGVALGIGPIILDAFSGLVHELESGYEVGDWIQVDENCIGKVTSISWRAVTVETNDHTTIVIPQRKVYGGYTNMSRPYKYLMQTVEVTLAHDIPIDRAERLLTGAVMLVKGVHNKTCSAWANKATEGGIVYAVRYLISDYVAWREVRHRVLEAITSNLHEYDLKISETIGEYGQTIGGKPFKESTPLLPEQILSKVDLFADLPQSSFAALCRSAKKQIYNKGAYIVQQGDEGDSLFVVAEGIVEVLLKAKGKTISLANLLPGAYFGEMSLLTGDRRSATVSASTNCAVFEISKVEIGPILKKDHKIVELLARKIEERNNAKITNMTHKLKEKKPQTTNLIASMRNYFGL